jgi:predicted nucleotide-binding protein
MKVARILIVDDSGPFLEYLRVNLASHGHEVAAASSFDDGERTNELAVQPFDIALVDLYIPQTSGSSDRVMRGEELAVRILERSPTTRVVGMSEHLDRAPFTPLPHLFSGFIHKPDIQVTKSPLLLFETVDGILASGPRRPKVFIVHGRDDALVLDLKNYLQNTLGLGEPIVLRERPSLGRTIIEKFETEARAVDLAFVLFTPDDALVGEDMRRARPNVLFELGFFFAKLQRTSGHVFVLRRGDVEIPTDISGLIYINVTDGLPGASEQIRRELKAQRWLT